jgi:NRPS condensation-like uncharacterized protein
MAKHKTYADWFKLDNAAKIFPVVSNRKETNTFRVQIELKEVVDVSILQLATDAILERFPMFKVRLKSGLFWYYLDYNERPFKVLPLPLRVCGNLSPKENNGYMLQVYHRGPIIAIEVFHSLADAGGAFMLLKSLVFEYFVQKGYKVTPDNMIITKDSLPTLSEYEDSQQTYYNPKNTKHVPEEKAYLIKGTPISDNFVGLISGTISTKALSDIAKKNQATITEYLVAHLMNVLYQTQIQHKEHLKQHKKPMKIFIPVNLRKHFPSKTLRNFSIFLKTDMVMDRSDITFEEMLAHTKDCFKRGLDKQELNRKMSENVSFERNIFLRLAPLFLKRLAMKIGYSFLGMSLNTMSFSNVGKIDFPKSMEPYIDNVSAAVYSGKNNTINCALCSFQDKFKITFTRSIVETTVEREFFRIFTSMGIPVEVESNFVEEY